MSFKQCPDCGYQEGDPLVIHAQRTNSEVIQKSLEEIHEMSAKEKLELARKKVRDLYDRKFDESSHNDYILNALANLEIYRTRVIGGKDIGEEPSESLDQLRDDLLCALLILNSKVE